MGFDVYALYVFEVCPLEYAEVQARKDEHQALLFASLDQSTDVDETMVMDAKTAWVQADAACRAAFARRQPKLSAGIETPHRALNASKWFR